MIDHIVRFISLLFFAAAIFLIGKEIHILGADNLIKTLTSAPIGNLFLLLCWTAINYLILSGYDWLGLRYIGQSLPYSKVFEGSAIGFAFSNTTGHIYASGGAIRYLFYLPQGISRPDILKMLVFETLTVLIGILSAFSLSVTLLPFEGNLPSALDSNVLYILALIFLILFALYYTMIIIPKRELKIRHFTLSAPTGRETLYQILIGFGDNLTLFLAFYSILRGYIPAPFFETFVVFILAQSLGFLTQVPGGLGVFEGSFLYLFPHTSDQKAGLLATLILFRLFYYFLPFILTSLYLGIRFLRRKHLF